MGVPVLPPRDVLEQGQKAVVSYNLPTALKKELERQAKIDGYEKTSPYVTQLLIHAIRQREVERLEQDKAKHK